MEVNRTRSAEGQRVPASAPGMIVALAWAAALCVSMLPNIVWRTVAGADPAWLPAAKLALLAGGVAAGFVWESVRPLRNFCLLLAALLLAEAAGGSALASEWRRRLTEAGPEGFAGRMLAEQASRLAIAGVMAAALVALGYRRRAFFLARGDLNAPAGRVPWLGIAEGTGWARLGPISGACISLGTLAFLVLAGRPSAAALGGALASLPWILALATLNAFSEELAYRAALLAPAVAAVGPRQAALITGVYFGIGHYYGMPNGVGGVIMAGLLGWYLGKCMLETRGFLWPWAIHFLQDVMIFAFLCAASISAMR